MIQKLITRAHLILVLYVLGSNGYFYYEKFMENEQLMESVPQLEAQMQKTRKEIKQLKDYYSDVEEAKVKIEKVAQEIEKIQRQLPTQINDADNLDMLSKAASKLNIKDVTLAPREEINKGFLIIKEYQFTGIGTFLQFLIMFEKISDREQLLNIGEVRFKRKGGAQKGRFQLINGEIRIQAYRSNENFKEDRGIEKIEADLTKEDKDKEAEKPKAKGKRAKKKDDAGGDE